MRLIEEGEKCVGKVRHCGFKSYSEYDIVIAKACFYKTSKL